jgi:hypothetical protein
MSQSGHFRAHARHQVDFPAHVEVAVPGAGPREQVRIVDLSLGGACIEAASTMAEGTSATVEVVSSILWDPLVLRGRVAWSRGADESGRARTGLCFEHDDAARTFALFELLGAQGYEI